MRFRHMTHMNRRLALLGLSALAFAPNALAQDLRPRTSEAATLVTLEGADRAAALGRVNAALNGVQRLQGRFVQTSPGGSRATGTFYLQRPGKLRFQYDPPATLLIVSDGSVVAMRDTAMRTTERTPLRSTPLHLILGENINLERNARIIRVSQAGEWTVVTARDRTGEMDGALSLHFDANTQLRSWDVTDATGTRTRVTLSDITTPASLDRNLFRLEDVLSNRPRR